MSTPEQTTERTDWSMLRDLWPMLRPDAPLYLLAIATAPVSAILVVAQPWLLRWAIDDFITPGDLEGLSQVALWYLAAILVGFFVQVGHTLALSYGAMRSITRVRARVYGHTIRLAQSYFDKTPTGRLLTRATNDVEALGETLTAGAITILLDALQVAGVLAAMFWLDARLTLFLLLVGPPLALIVDQLRRRLRKLYVEVRTSLSELNALLSERLDGVQTLQLYRDEARTMAAFEERLHRYRDTTIRTNVFDALLYATVDGLGSVTMALMLWYGSGGILEGTLTAGTLAAFIDYIAKLFRPVQEFSQKIAVLQRASAALTKIFLLLDEVEHISPGSQDVREGAGELRVTGMSFSYGDGPDILDHIDIRMAPGEVVALCGRTGSGKTTLGKLLTRAYEGYRGSIQVDGQELSQLTPTSVRRHIGAVRQDVQLFPGDVRFNLTLGADIPDDALREAIALAHATEVVERLGGLDGLIEEGGRNVSSGEAQLLSFARTMAYDPAIVILDEATASVDSLTEARIQAATEAILARKTTLVIAHRLSTIMTADRIAVLDAGRILELGSHDELMDRDGHYAELFRQQFAAAEHHAS